MDCGHKKKVTVEVVRGDNKMWEVRERCRDGYTTVLAAYFRQSDAELVARFWGHHRAQELSQSVELEIKNRKGQIRAKDTYGYDPESTRG